MVAESWEKPRGDHAAARRKARRWAATLRASAPVRVASRTLGPAAALATVGLAALLLESGSPGSGFLLIGIGTAGLVGAWAAERQWRQANEALAADIARERADHERLSDRIWELRESEERFRGLIDTLGDLVVHRDRAGRIVQANRVFAELVGAAPDQLAGRMLSDFGVEVGLVPDAAFASGECLSSTDVAVQTAKGLRWFSWIELSVRDEANDTVSHRAIARDITDRKRAETTANAAREKAEFASQAKSRFLATVSHEIRTPMNGIMGMATLLADTDLSAEQRTYVGAVSTSASALLALIEDLLDFSKIEAGRFELEPQPLSPRELVETIVELLASRALAKKIGIACHVAPDVPDTIRADPGRLRQVLLNLVGNAIKFTDVGGVTVTVAMSEGEARRITFAVQDTGPGFSDAVRDKIFEEFEQADTGPTRRHGGAGLGLAISKRIVGAMGGEIRAESTPGVGSRFEIEVPAEIEAEAEPGLDAALAGRSALIVSENRTEAEAIAMSIRGFGGAATLAGSAGEAAALLGQNDAFDTVLVDAALESGEAALLAQLRRAARGPFEAVTLIAPNDRACLGEFRASGYSGFLARPVRGDTLLRGMLARLSTEPASTVPAAADPRQGSSAGLSILLAEDNEINAMLARAALLKAGHRVQVVGNGKAAVDAVADNAVKSPFDVVLMDLHMPVMDGLTAIGQIRRREEQTGTRPVPIMVLSADGQDETRQSVLAHGATGFVTKPLDPHRLVEAIARQAEAA